MPQITRTPVIAPLLGLTLLGLLCGAPARGAEAPAAWPQELSDLRPDPAVRFGTLPNGLRFALLPHTTPRDRVSLRLRVATGSLMEEENERGLAHFLEHMAFKGSQNMPAGDLVKYLERLGMGFGADTNARTDFDNTVYQLELPSAQAELLDQGLSVLRETADRLLIAQAEADRERGVVLSEKRLRDTPGSRAFLANMQLLLPESLVVRRLPIGTEAVLETAGHDRLEHFYRTWYRPERMLLVAVGAVDLDDLEGRIRAKFSSLVSSGEPPRRASPGRPDDAALRVAFHAEAGGDASVTLSTAAAPRVGAETTASRREELTRYLANGVISRRIASAALKPEAPFLGGHATTSELFHVARVSDIRLSVRPERWAQALASAEQELRAALAFGFTAGELEEAKKNLLSEMDQESRAAATRESRALADELVESVEEDRVFTHPAADLALTRDQLAAVTPAQVQAALHELWDGQPRRIFVSGPMQLKDPTAEILAAYEAGGKVAVTPPVERDAAVFAYEDLGSASAVTERQTSRVLDVTQVRFGNNVRLNLKRTPFDTHTILVSVRVGAGRLSLPRDQPGLKQLADMAFLAGGLGRHSIDDLNRLTAGRNVELALSVEDDALLLRGRTTPEDLRLQLQLLRAYLTDPGYRPEAQQKFLRALSAQYRNLTHTPEGTLQREVSALVHDGDPRFGFPEEAQANRRTLAELRAWLEPQLKSAYLEISLVGDLDLDQALAQVQATFGSLPTRETSKPALDAERQVHFPANHTVRSFTFEAKEPRALALAYWPTLDARQVSESRKLYLLARVFTNRLLDRARNEAGLTYVAHAEHNASYAFPGYGFLSAMVDAPPDKAQQLVEQIQQIAAELAAGGISADELERARKPLVNEIRKRLEENEFLLSALIMASQEEPQRLARAATLIDDLTGFTLGQIEAVAKRYLAPGLGLPVLVLPAPKPAT